MNKKNEPTELEEVNEYIDYFERFIKVTAFFGDECHANEVLELEAPCRAAVHHVNTLLDYIRSAKEGILAENAPAEKAQPRLVGSHLRLVK